MKLRLPLFSTRPAFAGAALSAAVFAAAAGLVTTSPETMVMRGFAVALEHDGLQTSAPAKGTADLVAGTEEYWLDQKRKQDGGAIELQPAAWPGAEALGFAVGDRITISSGKTARVLEVVALTEAPASNKTRIETGVAGVHQMIVTCRDTLANDGRLLSFLTTGTGQLSPATTATKPPQTL